MSELIGVLHRMSPTEFEDVTVQLMLALGYHGVERIGGTGDLGVDVRCYDEFDQLVVVQCKRYAPDRPIGSPMIQHFMAMALHHGAAHKVFVTTSTYTAAAEDLARDADIELIDGSHLAELVAHFPSVHAFVSRFANPTDGVGRPQRTRRPVEIPTSLEAYDKAVDLAWFLDRYPPETPMTRRMRDYGVTPDEARRAVEIQRWLTELTPIQLGRLVATNHAKRMEDRLARKEIKSYQVFLLDHPNPGIKDFAIRRRTTSGTDVTEIYRVHQVPADQYVTYQDVYECWQMRYQRRGLYDSSPLYSTSSFFTREAYSNTSNHRGAPVMVDGMDLARMLVRNESLMNSAFLTDLPPRWVEGEPPSTKTPDREPMSTDMRMLFTVFLALQSLGLAGPVALILRWWQGNDSAQLLTLLSVVALVGHVGYRLYPPADYYVFLDIVLIASLYLVWTEPQPNGMPLGWWVGTVAWVVWAQIRANRQSKETPKPTDWQQGLGLAIDALGAGLVVYWVLGGRFQ